MTSERRLFFMKTGLGLCLGLLVLDAFVIGPGIRRWKAQGERIAALRGQVEKGRQLLAREAALRQRWAAMLRANMPAEASAAENAAQNALIRWKRGVPALLLNGVSPSQQWQSRGDDADTLEYRISATGSQADIARFLYAIESDDTLPVRLEECELTSRDARGSALQLTARLSFLRIREGAPHKPAAKIPNPAGSAQKGEL